MAEVQISAFMLCLMIQLRICIGIQMVNFVFISFYLGEEKRERDERWREGGAIFPNHGQRKTVMAQA